MTLPRGRIVGSKDVGLCLCVPLGNVIKLGEILVEIHFLWLHRSHSLVEKTRPHDDTRPVGVAPEAWPAGNLT